MQKSEIVQAPFLTGQIKNRFERLYFGLDFFGDLTEGASACDTAFMYLKCMRA